MTITDRIVYDISMFMEKCGLNNIFILVEYNINTYIFLFTSSPRQKKYSKKHLNIGNSFIYAIMNINLIFVAFLEERVLLVM